MWVLRRYVRMAITAIIPTLAHPMATMVRNGSWVVSLSVPVRGTTAIIDPASIDPACMLVGGTVREVTVEGSTGVLAIQPTAAADTLTMAASRTGRWVAASAVGQVPSTAAVIGNRRTMPDGFSPCEWAVCLWAARSLFSKDQTFSHRQV